MKKTEMTAIVERLDEIRKAKYAEDVNDGCPNLYEITVITARLVAEQTLMMSELLSKIQNLTIVCEASTDEVVGAIVQRTWPGVIMFEEDPPAEEKEDE